MNSDLKNEYIQRSFLSDVEYKQMSFLPDEKKEKCQESFLENENSKRLVLERDKGNQQVVSERLKDEFEYLKIPFIGCDYDVSYPKLLRIIPRERYYFDKWGIDGEIMAEAVCAGICHQMNWDYLRSRLYEKLQQDEEWVSPSRLICIDEQTVEEFFCTYNKPERIRARERKKILQEIGKWAMDFECPSAIFFDANGEIWDKSIVRGNLLKCRAFSADVEEKKMQLLLQKLSSYCGFGKLSEYCQPAIDYHLIRMYLRRGLLYPKTEYAKEFVLNPDIARRESTVAALRHHCSKLMLDICCYSELSVLDINQVDWHIGRSVCLEKKPDCDLENPEAKWLKAYYDECPFSNTCAARCGKKELLGIMEPTYKGSSY